MRGIFCLRLHSVSFPPGWAPVLPAALWPTMLLHWDWTQRLMGDFLAPLKLCGILTSVCAAQASVPKPGRTTKFLCHLTPVSCTYVWFSGPAIFFFACRSFDHHPLACVTVKASAAERSPGCPSMALSLPLGDNAFFPCHKADAVL